MQDIYDMNNTLPSCQQGYSYNAYFIESLGKLFVKSLRKIEKNEELFVSYGW